MNSHHPSCQAGNSPCRASRVIPHQITSAHTTQSIPIYRSAQTVGFPSADARHGSGPPDFPSSVSSVHLLVITFSSQSTSRSHRDRYLTARPLSSSGFLSTPSKRNTAVSLSSCGIPAERRTQDLCFIARAQHKASKAVSFSTQLNASSLQCLSQTQTGNRQKVKS